MPWYPRIFTIKKDGTRGSKHRFQRGRCSVGTAAGCDIHIRGADSSYCLFLVDKNMLAQVVNVTGSAGVKHNGERVRNTSFLSHGDIVQIGSRQFRFEWVNKRKKKSAQKRTKKSSKVAAASHQPKAAGDARESSTKHHESDNEARHKQQSRNRALHSSTSSTPLIDESRKRARRSRSCLPGMHNSFEEEYPSFQEGQSCSSLKRRSQSLENSIAERSCKLRRWRRKKGLKVNSFSHKENSSGFLTPGSQSWYPNGKATTDESFLDSPGLSRRALIRSQTSLCHTSLSSSAGSLGCESFFKTPNHTDSISKRELGPLTAQDVSNSSLGNKRAYKRLSHIANPRSHQSHAKSFTASPLSSRSRPSLEKNTNGAHTPSDHSARSTWANSSLGQNSECTNSFKRVVTADETISSFDGSNCEGQFGASTLGFLEQEEGVSAKKTGSKCAISTDSTSKKRRRRRKKKWNSTSFNESPGDKEGAAEVPSRAARSSITNSAVDSLTWVQLGSEGLLQGVFYVPAVFLNMVTPASNNRSKKESPEQEHAVASEEGDDKKEGVPPQYARDESQSDQESLEHMGIMAESPKVTVSKQTFQCSSQTLENSRESALEKATLLTRSGRFSHTPTSKEMREEVSELEATGTASALKAPTSRQTLPSRNVTEEMNRAVSTLSPGHMTLDDVDVENKEAQAQKNVDTPKPFQTSGGKQTPASSKISASEEATEQVIMGTSPIERPPLMNISPVVAESVGTQSTRSPCALTLKNSSTEATGDETVGLRPNSLNASGEKKVVSRKVNIEAPQQEMADTPKSLKASEAKQISASKKIKEGQGDLKQTTQASPSECVSFDNASAATEGFVRFTISSLSSASRNVSAVTPGMEEVCSQNVMGGSRVSSKSKEALAQETVDTPKSLNTSGGKQTPASGEIIVLVKEATEQNIVGASPVESPKSLEASTAHWAPSASNVVKEDLEQETRASPSKQVNEVEEVPELETAGVSLSKCSSATNVHALADEPVRPTRGCCTRGSRKDNEEAREEKKVDHPQSTKATRAKHTQGSRKAVKVDMAQTATEATPRKTRGRRAKALETALEWADDKPDASRRTAEDHSEEAPPAKRARKKV
ncbi:uncharacterized protein LOC144113031 isoform X1 [Amblyomma americanum]